MALDKKKYKEVAAFCLMALFAGITIGIGCTCFLLCVYSLSDAFGRVLGGFLFALGIFAIISFEMKLFTGMAASIPTMQKKDYWQLPVCFLCNALGVILAVSLIRLTVLADLIVPLAASVIEPKLAAEYWYVNAFISSILCGVMITMSILAPKYVGKKGLSVTLGVMLPIVVFALCGFDHSVANMYYFACYEETSLKVVVYILLTVLGNMLGGIALPLVINFNNSVKENANETSKEPEQISSNEDKE